MMKAHQKWQLKNLFQQIWVRVTLFSLLGVVTALCGLWFDHYVPKDWADVVGADAVDTILNILASSLLAVTTFSLSTMIGAFGSASTSATPRATQLLIKDQTTQNVLSSFVGAFVFSIVGIITIQAGVYGFRGKIVIFAVTLAVVAFVVFTLLRWINHLMTFGRLVETTQRVEDVVALALTQQAEKPCYGAQCLEPNWQPPAQAKPVYSPKNGYVQYIDVHALSLLCTEPGQAIYCVVQPGHFVTTATVIAYSLGFEEDFSQRIDDAFALDVDRSFEQDPRFGLCTLSEIASRALSPAVNDPGTAIEVISRGTRLLANFVVQREQEIEAREAAVKEGTQTTASALQGVYIGQASDEEMFDDFFTPIARDGASLIEVMLVLLNALEQLALVSPKHYAPLVRQHVDWVMQRAEEQMQLPYDKERLSKKVRAIRAVLMGV